MNKMGFNLQDTYLNAVRKEKLPVTIYLVNGVQLKGYIRAFDSFTVLLEDNEGREEMVYKHVISTICPGRNLNLNFGALLSEEN